MAIGCVKYLAVLYLPGPYFLTLKFNIAMSKKKKKVTKAELNLSNILQAMRKDYADEVIAHQATKQQLKTEQAKLRKLITVYTGEETGPTNTRHEIQSLFNLCFRNQGYLCEYTSDKADKVGLAMETMRETCQVLEEVGQSDFMA